MGQICDSLWQCETVWDDPGLLTHGCELTSPSLLSFCYSFFFLTSLINPAKLDFDLNFWIILVYLKRITPQSTSLSPIYSSVYFSSLIRPTKQTTKIKTNLKGPHAKVWPDIRLQTVDCVGFLIREAIPIVISQEIEVFVFDMLRCFTFCLHWTAAKFVACVLNTPSVLHCAFDNDCALKSFVLILTHSNFNSKEPWQTNTSLCKLDGSIESRWLAR